MECLYCNKRVGKVDMTKHLRTRHDVSTRDNSEFEKSVVIVEDEEYPVWVKGHIYRCEHCTIEANSLQSIEKHIYNVHVMKDEDKRYRKMMRMDEKKQKHQYCDICWLFFPAGSEDLLREHKEYDYDHQKKLKYEEGTGCDICRTTDSPLSKHLEFDTYLHKTHLRYKEGSGCDVCRRLDCSNHQAKELYIEGSGCDICKIAFMAHEETNNHKRTEKRRLELYKRFIAPTLRTKSARK